MAKAGEIVERFFNALYGGDPQTARQYLDDNVACRSPASSFSNADAYLRATQHAVRALKRLETRKVFVDGQDVCIFYDLHIDHPVGSITVADWYHLEGDKIVSIQTILDTAPFTAPTGKTAQDPVCGMTVAQASAAATRTYASTTYYFCAAGCAEAFDSQPEQYVAAVA